MSEIIRFDIASLSEKYYYKIAVKVEKRSIEIENGKRNVKKENFN